MNLPRVGIISQARTTSTRLPGKVLMKLGGKTILEHHLERLSWSDIPVFVATTINDTDDSIVSLCEKLSIPFYRGSEDDVLERFYECAKKYNLDIIVRVTSDCPLIDGHLIKEGVQAYRAVEGEAYVSNCIKRTYPRGFDFEIFSFKALQKAFNNATDKFEREHVTPFIRNSEKNGEISLIDLIREKDASEFRITLDEEDDFKLIKILIETYQLEKKGAGEIIEFLQKNSDIAQINVHVEQKKIK